MGEQILYPNERPKVSPQEAAAGLGWMAVNLLTAVEDKAQSLEIADDERLGQASTVFAQKITIMSDGIRQGASTKRMHSFQERTLLKFHLAAGAVRDVAKDRDRLVEMIKKIENDTQSDMIINKLLKKDARRQLNEIDEQDKGSELVD
jgi:hypothetical protein